MIITIINGNVITNNNDNNTKNTEKTDISKTVWTINDLINP